MTEAAMAFLTTAEQPNIQQRRARFVITKERAETLSRRYLAWLVVLELIILVHVGVWIHNLVVTEPRYLYDIEKGILAYFVLIALLNAILTFQMWKQFQRIQNSPTPPTMEDKFDCCSSITWSYWCLSYRVLQLVIPVCCGLVALFYLWAMFPLGVHPYMCILWLFLAGAGFLPCFCNNPVVCFYYRSQDSEHDDDNIAAGDIENMPNHTP
jgi:hypothetical protein